MSDDFTEIRQALAGMQRSLGNVEGSVAAIHRLVEKGESRHDGLDGRLRVVENRQHWYAGVWSVGSSVVTAILLLVTRTKGG